MTENKDIFAPKSEEQVLSMVLEQSMAWVVSLDDRDSVRPPLPLRTRVGQ